LQLTSPPDMRGSEAEDV